MERSFPWKEQPRANRWKGRSRGETRGLGLKARERADGRRLSCCCMVAEKTEERRELAAEGGHGLHPEVPGSEAHEWCTLKLKSFCLYPLCFSFSGDENTQASGTGGSIRRHVQNVDLLRSKRVRATW